MKLFLSAGEASSDRHAAELLRALQDESKKRNRPLDAFGIGGEHLRGAGLRVLTDQRQLSAMGFSEILGKIPRFLRLLRSTSVVIAQEKPDVCVVMDYPDFHLRLAQRAAQDGRGVPWVYYIPPKVWVWRSHRVQEIRRLFKKVLCILPFERQWYDQRDVPAVYVGNPLLDELPLNLTRAAARKQLGLPEVTPVVLLMPGSRTAELKQHLERMWRAVWLFRDKVGLKPKVLLALNSERDVKGVESAIGRLERLWPLNVQILVGQAHFAMRAADVGLIKSGTSTLEAALLGLPHAIVYRVSWLTTWVYHLWVRYSGPVGLPNLVLGRRAVPEVLLGEVTPERLSEELAALLGVDGLTPTAKKQGVDFKQLQEILGAQESPSRRAAQEIWSLVGGSG